MEFPKVICITRDRSFARQTQQAIGLSCARITIVTEVAKLSEEHFQRADLVLVDAQFLEEEPRLLLEQEPLLQHVTRGALALVNPTQLETCIELLATDGCHNVICGDPLTSNAEILTMLRKTGSPDIFGLEKYIPWGACCYDCRVSSLIDRKNVVSWVAATAHRVGTARWLMVELEIVTDELLSNAIYPEGTSDEERFQAGPVSSALLRWACTEGCIHISVTDRRGTFHKQQLLDALRELAAAPGEELSLLGLPRQIALAQRMVVNVVPGWCTEIILSVPLRGRRTAVPSIGYFATGELPDATAVSTAPVTININGRLLIESLGLEAAVSIRAINAISAEVTIAEPIARPIYPGTNFTLALNVPFHGEVKVSGLVFRVQEEQPLRLHLSFATGYQEWEQVMRTVLSGAAYVPAKT